jgi:hypothetical protein
LLSRTQWHPMPVQQDISKIILLASKCKVTIWQTININ